jgi:hypothetical protein
MKGFCAFISQFVTPSFPPCEQVAVKPAFDPSLLRLRDEMGEGKRRMEGLAKEAGKKVYGQVKDADKKIKLDWRCVGVWVCGWKGSEGERGPKRANRLTCSLSHHMQRRASAPLPRDEEGPAGP